MEPNSSQPGDFKVALRVQSIAVHPGLTVNRRTIMNTTEKNSKTKHHSAQTEAGKTAISPDFSHFSDNFLLKIAAKPFMESAPSGPTMPSTPSTSSTRSTIATGPLAKARRDDKLLNLPLEDQQTLME